MSELEKCYEREGLSPQFPYMPKEEREGRIKKARDLMEEKNIDALFLLNELSWIYYFGWVKPYPYPFATAGIIPKSGPAALITEVLGINNLELKGYAERAVGYRGDAQAPTPTAPEPVTAIAELIKDMGLDGKTLGVEMGPFSWWVGLTMREWEKLKSMVPGVKWVDASESVIWPQRMKKTPWEIEVIRKLCKVQCKGYMKAIEMAAPGVNEYDLFRAIMKVWLDEGIVDSISKVEAVNVSRNFAVAYYEDHILKEGDNVFLDGGANYKQYKADCQRIIWIGNPGREALKWMNAAEIAHIEVEDLLKPGTKLGDIWQKGHEVLARYLGDSIWKDIRSPEWIGWVGHSIGLGEHEPPYIVENSPSILEPGMIINIEFPALDVKKRVIWNMPEDTYLITEDGFECLTLGLGPKGVYVKE